MQVNIKLEVREGQYGPTVSTFEVTRSMLFGDAKRLETVLTEAIDEFTNDVSRGDRLEQIVKEAEAYATKKDAEAAERRAQLRSVES